MNKEELRAELKKARRELSEERRNEASNALLTSLFPSLAPYKTVLSFASLPEEVDTTPLNRFLAKIGRLLLPKVEGTSLKIYRVHNLDHLCPSRFGLLEPSVMCEEVPKEEVGVVLVPGLAFDHTHHRIGYGKGYYDRLLASIPHCSTIGLGFKEQLLETLPTEPTDFPLTTLSLF